MQHAEPMDMDTFFQIYRRIQKLWTAFAERAGISSRMFPHSGVRTLELFRYIRKHPTCSLAELAAGLEISSGGASSLVDQLFRAGFLSRTLSPSDRRRIHLALMPEGEAFLHHAEAIFQSSCKDVKRPT